jgi:S1-C subfamily serine protease
VTAWHVVKGAKAIVAKFSDGTEARVTGVIDKNINLDVAVIELESGNRKPLPLAEGTPKVGSKAFVIGAPKGMDFSISDGIISQTPLLGQIKLFQFTCPVSAGNSGGPLLNGSGQVTGVVSWQLRDAQNLNFAVPVSILSNLDASKAASPFNVTEDEDLAASPVLTTIDDSMLQGLIKKAELSATSQDDGTGVNAFVIDSEGTKLTMFQYAKAVPERWIRNRAFDRPS